MNSSHSVVLATAVASVLWTAPAVATPVRSAPVQVVTTTNCLHWNTVLKSNPVVRWAWPNAAQSAVVNVTRAMRSTGRAKTSRAVVSRGSSDMEAWTLPVALPSADAETGVISVEVEFHSDADGAGAVVAGETLRADGLGLVRGTSGTPLRILACDRTATQWSGDETFKGALLSVPAGTTGIAVDGEPIDLAGVPGWACVNLPARREVAVELSAGAVIGSATLYRAGVGMSILLY